MGGVDDGFMIVINSLDMSENLFQTKMSSAKLYGIEIIHCFKILLKTFNVPIFYHCYSLFTYTLWFLDNNIYLTQNTFEQVLANKHLSMVLSKLQ